MAEVGIVAALVGAGGLGLAAGLIGVNELRVGLVVAAPAVVVLSVGLLLIGFGIERWPS